MMKMRSKEKELIDLGESYYTHEEYIMCLKILFKVNKLMGIFNSTVRLLRRFPDDISLIDVGCGGGLFLLNLSKYYPKMRLLGIDVSKVAIDIAQNELACWKKANPKIQVEFQLQHQLALELSTSSTDVVLTTLVCHHIDDDDLIEFLQNAHQAARRAVIIHDLQRHLIGYWLYKQISPILFRNRLITHDGLISIQRSFTRSELKSLLQRANISNYQIKWGFPFRWSVILWKK